MYVVMLAFVYIHPLAAEGYNVEPLLLSLLLLLGLA